MLDIDNNDCIPTCFMWLSGEHHGATITKGTTTSCLPPLCFLQEYLSLVLFKFSDLGN